MTIRVVQVNCPIDVQGRAPHALLKAWPTLPAVARATSAAGVEVTVVQASRYDAEIERDGVRYIFVRQPQFAPHRLAAAVRKAAPDLIHFHGLDFPLHARAVCSLGVPVLVQDHASQAHGRWRALRRWGYRRIAAAAFTAIAQAAPFTQAGILPPSIDLFAIPESSSAFTPGDQLSARMAAGIYGYPALLWVGHLDANKDPLTVLRGLRTALPALPGAQLWCAFGKAPLMAQVEALLATDPALAARVHLIGHVPHAEMEAWYRAADIFLSSSQREGSGYALLEALACGLPPIVSDIPSFRELTGNGQIGALCTPGDSAGFARALLGWDRFSRADVRTHFDRHASFQAVGAQLAAAYEQILARARRG